MLISLLIVPLINSVQNYIHYFGTFGTVLHEIIKNAKIFLSQKSA